MKYHSVVLYVKNIDNAKRFYCDYLSIPIEMDMGKNVILKNGITLWEIQEENIIVNKIGKDKIREGNKFELYFETDNMDKIIDLLEKYKISKLHDLHEESWGQRTIRFYDYDMNIIEVGEELNIFLERMINSGMEIEELIKKTGMTKEDIKRIIG